MKTSRIFLILILFVCPFSRISAGVMILNGLTHFHNGMGGNTISGIITMKNDGKKESRVVIYMQDLGLSCDKPVDYFEVNSHNRSLGKWLKTNVDEKVLQPGEEYEVSYTINVPAGKFEEGTYYSIIMVEVADPLHEETPQGVKIDSKVRYAIQVIADVGAYKHPKLAFEKVEFKKGTSDSTTKVIQVKLKNEGDFMVKAKLNIEIFNSLGEKVKVINGLQKKVYPTHCNDFEIELKGLPKGKYEGVLVADNGKDLFGENMTIEIE
jgi:hypothetical protein